MRVLIADDTKDVLEMLAMVFEQDGWEVATAGDGREALRIYHDYINAEPDPQYFDLVLLDVIMSPMNGIAVGNNIRNMERWGGVPRAAHVYLTGHQDKIAPDELLEGAFADEFFIKPIEMEKLLARCRELCEKQGEAAP